MENMRYMSVTMVIYCIAHTTPTTGMEKLRDIRLQGFLPMTGTGWPIGGACLPATLLAVRQVNEREGLLDGYNISYSWADTEVSLMLLCSGLMSHQL